MAEIQSVLFLYMLIGWICRKTDLVKAAAQPSFTNFLLYVSIPCMVFQSFDMEFTMETLYRGASVSVKKKTSNVQRKKNSETGLDGWLKSQERVRDAKQMSMLSVLFGNYMVPCWMSMAIPPFGIW